MVAYGKIKRVFKTHPHNQCSICGESNIIKKRERQKARKVIDLDLDFDYSNKAILNNKKGGRNVITK